MIFVQAQEDNRFL